MQQHKLLRTLTSKSLYLFILTLFSIYGSCSFAMQDDDWWFNVEFIAFKRYVSPSYNEDFQQANFEFSDANSIDIMSLPVLENLLPYHTYTRTLPSCTETSLNESNRLMQISSSDELEINSLQHELIFYTLPFSENYYEMHLTEFSKTYPLPSLTCLNEQDIKAVTNSIDNLDRIPRDLFASSEYFQNHIHLISRDNFTLDEFSKSVFAQRDIAPLIRVAWRQNMVFGIENAPYVEIKAGRLLTLPELKEDSESVDSELLTQENMTESNFFDLLKQDLEQNIQVDWFSEEIVDSQSTNENTPINNKWEMEGLFKIYLDYINQVPYLHIESEFKHYKLKVSKEGKGEIDEYPFKQRRRIISKQIHYFDHPAFGIIVRLERYRPPVETEPETNLISEAKSYN